MVPLRSVDHAEGPMLGQVVAVGINNISYEGSVPEFNQFVRHHRWSFKLPCAVLRVTFSLDPLSGRNKIQSKAANLLQSVLLLVTPQVVEQITSP